MNQATAVDSEEPVFDALLTPHRSLGRTGFLTVMGICAVVWLGSGLFFLSKGAWPVFGFFGLDVLLLWLAFKWNYRDARAREEVTLWRHAMRIRKIAPSGRTEEHRFNPFWTRFLVSRHDVIGITGMNVVSSDRNISIGQFLNPDDRDSFAKAFSAALATAKRR